MRHCPAELFGLRSAKTNHATSAVSSISAMTTTIITRPTRPPRPWRRLVAGHSVSRFIRYTHAHTHTHTHTHTCVPSATRLLMSGSSSSTTRDRPRQCKARHTLPVFTGRAHGPSTRPVNTGVKNETQVHRPCTRASFWTPVYTGSVYRA